MKTNCPLLFKKKKLRMFKKKQCNYWRNRKILQKNVERFTILRVILAQGPC